MGDGEKCHLGRKLAMSGYQVVSVDPMADKSFTWKTKNSSGGNFRAIRQKFFDYSENMIDWAHVIVGNKIPPIVEDLIKVNKPTVFTISSNPEMYKMKFRGVPITSAKQFKEEIKQCEGVTEVNTSVIDIEGKPITVFEKEGRQLEGEDR